VYYDFDIDIARYLPTILLYIGTKRSRGYTEHYSYTPTMAKYYILKRSILFLLIYNFRKQVGITLFPITPITKIIMTYNIELVTHVEFYGM